MAAPHTPSNFAAFQVILQKARSATTSEQASAEIEPTTGTEPTKAAEPTKGAERKEAGSPHRSDSWPARSNAKSAHAGSDLDFDSDSNSDLDHERCKPCILAPTAYDAG